MTPNSSRRSTPAHRVALVALAVLVVATSLLLMAATPAEDADARPASSRPTTEPSPFGELVLISVSRTDESAERARADRVRRAVDAAASAAAARAAEAEAARMAAEAEAARLAAEQAATARAEAERAAAVSSMGSGWAALRRCESGGDYGAVSSNGSYRGAYQFSRSTWNSVAARSHPHLVGIDPAAAAPADQDAMALALYRSSGSGPWPHCGRHL